MGFDRLGVLSTASKHQVAQIQAFNSDLIDSRGLNLAVQIKSHTFLNSIEPQPCLGPRGTPTGMATSCLSRTNRVSPCSCTVQAESLGAQFMHEFCMKSTIVCKHNFSWRNNVRGKRVHVA